MKLLDAGVADAPMGWSDSAESLARSAIHVMRDRFEQPLKLQLSTWQKTEPTVYFLGSDINQPSGGSRVVYRHCDILRAAGIRSVVLHRKRGFRHTWFSSDTEIRAHRDCALGPRDLLVVSELSVDLLALNHFFPRHIVLNQSGHMSWQNHPMTTASHYRSQNRPLGMIVTSERIKDVVEYALPWIDMKQVRLSVDFETFHPGNHAPDLGVGFMSRRGAEDAHSVFGMLQGRGLLDQCQIVALEKLTEHGVAEALRRISVFLSVSTREGFGLPVLEAMASGCYVIGYHAFGSSELMQPEFSSAVVPGDLLGLARSLESAIHRETAEPGWLRSAGLSASEFVRNNYSPAEERAAVLESYLHYLFGTAD